MNLMKKVLSEIFPKVEINKTKREVTIKENLIGSNVTELFYTLKGYKVKYNYESLPHIL